jgi:hypothetical protein
MSKTDEFKTTQLSAFSIYKKERKTEAWSIASEKQHDHWTEYFILLNKDELDWKALSFNDSLPWTVPFIQQFEDKWDWHALSYIIADKSYFERSDFDLLLSLYMDKLDWSVICAGNNLKDNHLIAYANFIHWRALSSNNGFIWSESFINEHINDIDWAVFTECLSTAETSSVMQNAFRAKVLELYADNLDFDILSENDQLNFTVELLECYKEKWNWGKLINNSAIAWEEDLLRKFDNAISIIPYKALKESYMWTVLMEQRAEVEVVIAML